MRRSGPLAPSEAQHAMRAYVARQPWTGGESRKSARVEVMGDALQDPATCAELVGVAVGDMEVDVSDVEPFGTAIGTSSVRLGERVLTLYRQPHPGWPAIARRLSKPPWSWGRWLLRCIRRVPRRARPDLRHLGQPAPCRSRCSSLTQSMSWTPLSAEPRMTPVQGCGTSPA